MTTMIIAKTALGAGVISMPYTVRHLGYCLSIAAFLFFFWVNRFSSMLLLKSKNLSKHSNYSTILYHLFHKNRVRIFASALIAVNNFMVSTTKVI
jgi:amino acid permease